jgi:NADH-quinone oxidoreductase subunit H
MLYSLVYTLLVIVPLLVAVAFFTVAERKIMGTIQRRRGPDVIGVWGLLQSLADGLKLVLKEIIIPSGANSFILVAAPISVFILALISWVVIPFSPHNVFINSSLNVLYVLAVSSLGVCGIILAGWASNSKYAFLGSLRAAAQMVSYEISMGFVVLPIILCTGSLNIYKIVEEQNSVWLVFPFFPLICIFWVATLAETNRAPFDLPEAEAEIVAGYNVEYSGMIFAMFFLGEYSNMLLMASITTCFFFGGWLPFSFSLCPMPSILDLVFWFMTGVPEFWFSLKVIIFSFLFILFRACLPRYRYDQLMDIGWKKFLPFTLGFYIYIISILYSFDGLPF